MKCGNGPAIGSTPFSVLQKVMTAHVVGHSDTGDPMTTTSPRSSLRQVGASLASLVVGGSAAVTGVGGIHAVGASEAPHGDEGGKGSRGDTQEVPRTHLEVCAPNLGGTKVVQGFFDQISMTKFNQVRVGQTVDLKFRVINTDNNCIVSDTGEAFGIFIDQVSCPTGRSEERSINVVSQRERQNAIGFTFDSEQKVFVDTISIPDRGFACFAVTQRTYDAGSITANFIFKR